MKKKNGKKVDSEIVKTNQYPNAVFITFETHGDLKTTQRLIANSHT